MSSGPHNENRAWVVVKESYGDFDILTETVIAVALDPGTAAAERQKLNDKLTPGEVSRETKYEVRAVRRLR